MGPDAETKYDPYSSTDDPEAAESSTKRRKGPCKVRRKLSAMVRAATCKV